MKSPTPEGSELGSQRLWFASIALLARVESDFFSHWEKAVQSFDEDEIHDLRVASRRLHEGLALFAPCFPSKKVERLSKLVKRVTRLLGSLRNADEAYLFFSALDARETSLCRDEVDQLLKMFKGEGEEAREKLGQGLKSLDSRRLRAELRAMRRRINLFRGRGVDPFCNFALFAGDALQERTHRVVELIPGALNESDIAAQHQLRIAFKKMRYRLEIIEPLHKEACNDLRTELKSYQDLLGKLHDIDVFGDMVRERIPEGAGREELLRVMSKRRGALYASFLAAVETVPVAALAEKVSEALRGQGEPARSSSSPAAALQT